MVPEKIQDKLHGFHLHDSGEKNHEKRLYFFLFNSWLDQRITQGSKALGALSSVCRVLTFCKSQTLHLGRPGVPTLLPAPLDKCSPFPTFEPHPHPRACEGVYLLIHSSSPLKCH